VITSYSIMIRKSDGVTYASEITNCNGSNASIVTANSCTIPMQYLQASPFNLAWGASVFAKVIATNVVGSSASSEEGNGAVMLTNPDAPASLTNLAA
jgi:hypothetical protein